MWDPRVFFEGFDGLWTYGVVGVGVNFMRPVEGESVCSRFHEMFEVL